jgi:putative iron-dependent peroxidase
MSNVKPQAVVSRLSSAAVFLVVTLQPGAQARDAVRGLCGGLAGLVRAVGFRDLQAGLSCVMGIGSEAWDRLFDGPRPRALHPFVEINGVHHAPSTPGDLLFHVRATRMDLCFETTRQILVQLGDAVATADEVHGFKYFDDRDLIGFVDGTENPVDADAAEAVLVGDEDPDFAGSSYVIVQKYLHDLTAWNKVPVEQQEAMVGRHKLSDIEIPDADKAPYAHNKLTTLTEDGKELKIVRDNMPFGNAGQGEFGTYFIGYARSPARTEKMLHNMFVGNPPGTYDRLLDFSKAVTGSLYFVPSATFLDGVEADGTSADPVPTSA